ncbi:MAG: AAA family ATPase [Alphaproteobacteria bacterium]|nr:AAA family ATPase [Alphaproteobacteria bacterium]
MLRELIGESPPPEKEKSALAGTKRGLKNIADIENHCQQHTMVSALDQPLKISLCRNLTDTAPAIEHLTLRQFASKMADAKADTKKSLPLVKLGSFKGGVAAKNLESISGVEGDYDAGLVSVDGAEARLRAANVAALIYTSASHTSDKPRWRVLCPTSKPLPPADRLALIERVNGALGGILADESFRPAQRYFYGNCATAWPADVRLIDGRSIDATDLKRVGKCEDLFSSPSPGRPTDWPKIKSALTHITDTADRDVWRDIGAALHDESGGSDHGYQVWCNWSEQSYKFDSLDQRRTWRGFGKTANPLTIGTLFHRALSAGWTHGVEILPDDFDDLPEPKNLRLSFLSPADCEASASRGYVIKGLIAPRDVACIFGAPGAGKSLLAPFLGYMSAKGTKAFGMRTKPVGVFYVAAEDGNGMRGRVKALKTAHGDAPGFQLVEGVSDLLAKNSADQVALKEAVKAQRPGLIFIDTLAMAFPGLEENSAMAMGRVVAVARSLTKWGAAVVLIHHDTKAADATPRGHSLLNGALDVALHVKRGDGGIIRGELTKNRNGSCDRDIAFTIQIEHGGIDEDGDTITLPRASELTAGESFMPKLTRSENLALEALEAEMRVAELCSDEMDQAVSVPIDDWRRSIEGDDRFYSGDKRNSFNVAFKRALGGLSDKGVIEIVTGDGGGADHAKPIVIRDLPHEQGV